MDNPRVTLNIQNNLSYPTTISILGNPYNLRDTSNAKTEYRWNITALTFTNENTLTLEYKLNGATSFSVFTSGLNSANIQAVINALNNLGIGFFNTYVSGGQTFISTYNDQYAYGQLNIYSTLPSLSYSVNMPTFPSGFRICDANNNPPFLVNLTGSFTQSGIIDDIYVGEQIQYRIGSTTTIFSTITETNNITGVVTTLLNNVTNPLIPYSFVFTIVSGYSYNITTTE